MKKYLKMTVSLCLALLLMTAALPVQAADEPFFVNGYTVERTDSSGNPAEITVTLMRTDGGTEPIRVVRNVDDFSGGSEGVFNIDASGKYTLVISGLRYRNSGNTLGFSVVYGGGTEFQTFAIRISECTPYEEPEEEAPTESPAPRAIFSTDGYLMPISANETAIVTIYIENAGSTRMRDPVVSFSSSGDLMLLGGQNTYYLDDIRPGRSVSVDLTVKAMNSVSSQNQSIDAELDFEYDNNITMASGTSSGRVSVPARISSYVDPADIDSPVPVVILSSYHYGGGSVAAGSTAKLDFSFKNTSRTIPIDNVVVSVSGGVDLMLNGSANTFYFDSIAAGGSKSISVPMKAAQRISANTQDVVVSVHYEYVDHNKRGSNSTDLSISVPLYQPDRFDIDPPTAPYVGAPYEEISLTMDYVNRGKTEVSNVEASVVGDIETATPLVRVGNVEAGKSGTIAFSVTPMLEGDNQVTVKLTYEDSNGEQKERIFETVLTTVAYDEPSEDWGDPMEPVEEGGQFPWWILLAVVPVGGVVLLVLRKKKKKKAELAAEQDLWDAWDEDEKKEETVPAAAGGVTDSEETDA